MSTRTETSAAMSHETGAQRKDGGNEDDRFKSIDSYTRDAGYEVMDLDTELHRVTVAQATNTRDFSSSGHTLHFSDHSIIRILGILMEGESRRRCMLLAGSHGTGLAKNACFEQDPRLTSVVVGIVPRYVRGLFVC